MDPEVNVLHFNFEDYDDQESSKLLHFILFRIVSFHFIVIFVLYYFISFSFYLYFPISFNQKVGFSDPFQNTACPSQKYNRHFWYRLRKNPLRSLKNQTILWNYDYSSTIQWRPHLIWPSSNKEIWIFVKQDLVIGPFLPSFVTWMYVASTGRLCLQKTDLQTYSDFMHIFLTKVVPNNLKACQICKIM